MFYYFSMSKNEKSSKKMKKEKRAAHLYLDAINSPLSINKLPEHDHRQAEWKKEKEKYGFSAPDTWSLDYTIMQLLYERLKMYEEIAGVDSDYHEIKVGKKTKTQRKWLEELLELGEYLLRDEGEMYFVFDDAHKKARKFWKIWSKTFKSFWW